MVICASGRKPIAVSGNLWELPDNTVTRSFTKSGLLSVVVGLEKYFSC